MKSKPTLFIILFTLFFGSCMDPEQGIKLTEEEGNYRISFGSETILDGGTVVIGSENNHQAEGFKVTMELTDQQNVIGFYLKNEAGAPMDGTKPSSVFFSDILWEEGLAFYRYGPWKAWTKPMKIKKMKDFPENDVQCFLFKKSSGKYVVMIPLSGNGYRSTLGAEQGIGAKAMCGVAHFDSGEIPQFVLGYGSDPYRLLAKTYQGGLSLMGLEENLRKKKSYPEIFEHIGWCTWNGLGHSVNKETISHALETFKEGGVIIPNLIIDDGWHAINEKRQLISFKPSQTKFPEGFSPLIDHLKSNYKIKNVGAWLTLNGYWNGIDPASGLGQKYSDILFRFVETDTLWIQSEKEVYYVPSPETTEASRFFNDWFELLKNQGITFLKVDNQLVTERIANGELPVWEAAKNMHQNLRKPAETHFNSVIINCMDMTNDAFYHFGKSSVARAVEDYFPYQEDETYNLQKGNAAAHVLSAIYNSLYFSQMVWPDFDMFQTHNPNGEYHAISRAISGGAIYLTDTPGEQDFEIIKKLTYEDGRIIRADQPLLPTEDCLFQVQEAKPFKAFTFVGETGILGVWNAADADMVSGSFRASDIHDIQGASFVVYDYFEKKYFRVQKEEALEINLPRMGYKLFFVMPEQVFNPVGLTDNYNAPGTIASGILENNTYKVTLYEGGTFTGICEQKPKNVLVNGQPADYSYSNGIINIGIPVRSKEVKLHIEL